MLTRLLLFFIVIFAAASVGHSQPAADTRLPEPCRGQRTEGLPALEKRKQRLEREIALARAAPAKSAQAQANAKALSKSQSDLLKVLFQIECAKAAQPRTAGSATGGGETARPAAPEARPPAPGAAPRHTRSLHRFSAAKASARAGNAVEVITYFATNRGRTGDTQPANSYDATIATLSYGRALVSIPSTHKPGSLELPSIWKLEFRADPTRHFVLKEAKALSKDGMRAEMAKALAQAPAKSLLVFVHGYNTSFAETAMRTAQLAYDLEFRGIPFFFSWPSAGKVTGYLRDVETAQLSENAFDRVLDDLSLLPVKDVYVVAHSMGSRIVSQVLKARVDKGKPTARLSELLLAAPDINADLFRTVIAPRLRDMRGTQTTVYASSSDLALRASKAVHGYPRVGETADGVFVFPGLETIDASKATMAVRAFGHSYLTDSAAVLSDIRALLRKKLSAKERGLAPVGASPNVYWSLR